MNPDRVLLLGADAAVGWGVSTHDLALTGHLARALTAQTGRGTDVVNAADPDFTIETAAAIVEGLTVTDFDAVVVLLGTSDAFQRVPLAIWRRELDALLTAIRARGPAGVVSVIGVTPPSRVRHFEARPGGRADQWAERLNKIAEAVTNEHGDHYLAPVAPELVNLRGPFGGSEEYRRLARPLAEHLSSILEPRRTRAQATANDAAISPAVTKRRLEALEDLKIAGTEPESRFDHVILMAQAVFGTTGAAFTVVDADRQWSKAAIGTTQLVKPLKDSFCATTILNPTALIVEDAWNDPRPLPRTDIRFYAGYPVEAPGGTRVGAICVFDSEPHRVTTVQVSFLRELAIVLEYELATAG